MPGTGVMEKIKALLSEGKSSTEIIALRYKPSTVYKAQRQMLQGGKASHSSGNGVPPVDQPPQADGHFEPAKERLPLVNELLGPEVEADPEVVQLKIDLRKAQLEREIAEVKAPLEVEGRLARSAV